MNADELEASQREREWFHALSVPPGLWTIIRVDGRGFSRLTEDHFAKPYDERMREHMTAAAAALVTEFSAVYGCTHSDEISVALPPSSGQFGRSLEKLVSVSAGIASATFTAAAGLPGHFDARVWIGAAADDVVDYFSWRQSDAARSALGTWCYWTMRQSGQSAKQATAALNGTGTPEQNELLYQQGRPRPPRRHRVRHHPTAAQDRRPAPGQGRVPRPDLGPRQRRGRPAVALAHGTAPVPYG